MTGANWFTRARLLVGELAQVGRHLGGRGVPDAPALPVRDPWPGDPARGSRIMRGEFDERGGACPIGPGLWHGSGASELVHASLLGFSWLRDLRALGSDGARAKARALAQDWLSSGDLPPLARSATVAGTRITAWLAHYDFFAASADDGFRQRLMARLLSDARALLVQIPADYADGRALAALKGLAAAATAFPDQEAILRRLLKFLPQELERQMLPDGMHAERSPGAHLQALQNLIEIRAMLQSAQVPPVSGLTPAIERMAAALRMLRHGDGSLALFNGTVEYPHALIEQVLTQAGRASRAIMALEHGGFARLQAGRSVLIADCGAPPPPGRDRHAHAGTLSFEFSSARERIITNCGALPGASGDWHDALRTTAAHSTLVIADTNSAELAATGLGRRASQVSALRQDSGGAQWLEMSHDGYQRTLGILHHRRLQLSPSGDELRGEDIMEGTAPYGAIVRFHLHPNVQASLQQDREAILLRLPQGGFWRFSGTGLLGIEESIHFGGSEPRRSEQLTVHIPSDGPQSVRWDFTRMG